MERQVPRRAGGTLEFAVVVGNAVARRCAPTLLTLPRAGRAGSNIRSLPGAYETAAAVLNAMADIEVYDRPANYVQTLKSRIEAQTDAEVRAAAEQVIEPDVLTFVIVADLPKIEKPIRALEVGEVKVIDVDGTAAHIGVPRAEGQRRPRTSKTALTAIRPFGSRSVR